MARENESRPLNGQPRDDAGEDADRREDEEENASEGNKPSDGEDVTMADYRFDVNNLFQNVLQQISTGLEEFSNTNVKEIEASATDLTETIRSTQDHALERKRKLEADMMDYQHAAQKVLRVLELGASSLHEIGFLESGEQEQEE